MNSAVVTLGRRLGHMEIDFRMGYSCSFRWFCDRKMCFEQQRLVLLKICFFSKRVRLILTREWRGDTTQWNSVWVAWIVAYWKGQLFIIILQERKDISRPPSPPRLNCLLRCCQNIKLTILFLYSSSFLSLFHSFFLSFLRSFVNSCIRLLYRTFIR